MRIKIDFEGNEEIVIGEYQMNFSSIFILVLSSEFE
jgi:hypothetical protein